MLIFTTKPSFIWSANADGLAVRVAKPKLWKQAKALKAPPEVQQGYRRMQMLAECREAEISEVDCGIFIAKDDAVRLDEITRRTLEIPECWHGGMRLTTESAPNLPGFSARIGLVDPLAEVIWNWELRGPILEVNGNPYLPTAAQFTALSAFKEWQALPSRDELDHLSLLASLREAHEAGCPIDLEAYRDDGANIVRARDLIVHAAEDAASGDLILCPLPQGDFEDVTTEEIQQRLSQLDGSGRRKVIRVGKRIILLDEEQTAVARAIKSRPRVPRVARENFQRDPAGWLSDHVFPDVPVEFSPRVTGIGEWRGGYLGGANGDPEDWFGAKPEIEKPVPKPETVNGKSGDDDDEEGEAVPTEKPLVLHPLIIPNDVELGYGWSFHAVEESQEEPFQPDFSQYQRQPMLHQEEAIRWLLGHAKRALKNKEMVSEQRAWGAGALLADDMGLGKSFTTLIALAEWMRHWRSVTTTEPPAMLFVVPLSLMENWKSEIEKAFGSANGPFLRVAMAQPDFELHQYRRSPGAVDVAEPGNVREFGLCFGDGTERSLDMPGSCVITTYQTLRDYRFSFAAAQWGAAIFDEAQHIKNPNAQQTIAAKALRALFRITLTGTPVENHLGDFWCILDTAEPGPLGAFADFRKRWIAPMIRERARMHEIGRELRDMVGGLMLRRTKEERLTGLPGKSIVPISCPMTSEQEEMYSEAREAVTDADPTEEPASKGRHLAALWHLRQVSLHPDLIGGGSIRSGKTETECRKTLSRSGKLAWLLVLLDGIRRKGEKALIFCVLKELQEALSSHFEVIYGIPVPIINGDTKATSRRDPGQTRLGLIEEFSSRNGFALCVLSPIAAGAGLNIVAANHVIHLERHWNPAKEDQATDRAYRIGQQKAVTVYLPSATHGEFASFDMILHKLLEKKRALQGALGLVPPDAVSAPELIAELFGQTRSNDRAFGAPISLDDALHLSWQMFEALIAVFYERESERVILTPHTADHGSDVVALGWGVGKENVLIQCKFTKAEKYDSEEGVRAVSSSAPFFERPLGEAFSRKALHSTARKFGRRTKRSAEICSVDLYGRNWLSIALQKHRPTLKEVLDRSTRREKFS
ncbi:MAG: restriction endonuclease [Verrucomicrobiaceae bacterium]|nr:restriction endonuclease [Verrucomicrobiaceae bacterium]